MLRPLLALLLLACSAPAAQDAAERPPNLLLILADDMGYGDPACFQAESAIPTPHLDRLASEGVRFTDAHSPGSVCVPTRYGLMTGRYPCRERRFPVGRGSVIEAERLTLPGHLRAAGYATAMVGKWHLGFDGGPLPTSAELRGALGQCILPEGDEGVNGQGGDDDESADDGVPARILLQHEPNPEGAQKGLEGADQAHLVSGEITRAEGDE